MCSTAFCLPLLITAPNHRVWLSGPTLGSTLWFPGLSYLPSGIGARWSLDVTGTAVLAHFTDEERAQGLGVGTARGRASSKIQVVWQAEALPLQPAMCPRVQTSRLCMNRGQGNQAGVVRSSLKGGTGLGMNRVLNNKASDLMLQATSSPRNRRHNISGTDLVKKHVVSTAYTSFIGKETKLHELHGADSVLWPGDCFPFGSRHCQGLSLLEATQVAGSQGPQPGGLLGKASFPPVPSTSPVPPGAMWSVNTDLLLVPVPGKGRSCHHCHVPTHASECEPRGTL